ncbi:MAG: nb-arc domain-containing protein, partial [Saccharothrix sp.]|nr:nb-arc domain-containing protein [Saccharothrix sp.]
MDRRSAVWTREVGEKGAVNELSGRVEGAAVQAGTVHGGVHLHAAVPVRPVPRQLPADVAGFTGREEQLAWLDGHVRQAAGVVVVTGTAGVGKTSLVVRWAHRRLEDFPDGQLHVDLHGCSPRGPLTSGEALTGFLHALHVHPETIPVTDDAKAALYRSLTHGRRLLVVLDNAADADQVRPLLPGSGTVLVTSRYRLAGLVARDGAGRLGLDVLPPAQGVALLRAGAGADRVDGDPEGAARLAEQCAYLPLALRVAAERIAAD